MANIQSVTNNPVDGQYTEIVQKTKEIAKLKQGYHINENILTPTMGEMMEEDLAYEVLGSMSNALDGSGDAKKAAFYTQAPFSENLGYNSDLNAILVKAKPINTGDEWGLNEYDGDTLYFDARDVDAGSNPISINGVKYNSFLDYFKSKDGFNVNSTEDQKYRFGTRFVGINCAEVPHITKTYSQVKTSNDGYSSQFFIKKIKEVKNNKSYTYALCGYDPNTGKAVKRNPEDEAIFIRYESDNKYFYKEIRKPTKSKKTIEYPRVSGQPEIIKKPEYNNLKEHEILEKVLPSYVYKTDDRNIFLSINKDETTPATMADGMLAQKKLKEQVMNADGSAKELYLVLDCGTLTKNKVSKQNITVDNVYYTKEYIETLIDCLKMDISDLRSRLLQYNLYGADTYGRFLTEVYTKDKNGKWINLNKLVLASTEHTEARPDYTGDPEINDHKLSDAFKIWSYDYEGTHWVDAFENMTEESYNNRIKLHEKLSGLKFCHIRDYSVLLGDTLLVIPPTNIKSVNQTTYERVPLLRAKGSLAKGKNHTESLLEMTLFFNGDHGVNGTPIEHTYPTGKKTTYYMNGLRGLIAQFKLTPYLPIENQYINDVLGIEAVSLLNLTTETVPEYPHLIQATLTLRAFNYRMYMPDLPLGIEQDIAIPNLSETNPIFAKCFQWDVFRYYYQRLLIAGESLNKLPYNKADYNEFFYRVGTSLQPTTFCNSDISFYIPDINWLDKALQIKSERDKGGMAYEPLELTDNARKAIDNLLKHEGTLTKAFSNLEGQTNSFDGIRQQKDMDLVISKIPFNFGGKFLGGKSRLRHQINTFWNPINEWLERLNNTLNDDNDLNSICSSTTWSEKLDVIQGDGESSYKLTWTVQLKLNTFDKLSQEELKTVKEFLSVNTGIDKAKVLPNNSISFDIVFESAVTDEGLVANKPLAKMKASNSNFNSILSTFKDISEGNTTAMDRNNMDAETFDYRDPAKLPFVPFAENIRVQQVQIGIANSFTETTLKSVDGISGQYVGGQDMVIETVLTTCDQLVISALHTLPNFAFETANKYKRILACAPIKIKNDMTLLFGINEVLIDSIDVNTVEGSPGLYEIRIRMTSLDRTLRQREQLRKLDIKPNGGFVGRGHGGQAVMRSYFDVDELLSQVEVYPDLELPSLDDLAEKGYCFVRYRLSNTKRVYPDPDFYLVYSYGYTAAHIKKTVDDYFKKVQEDADKSDEEVSGLSKVNIVDTELGAKIESRYDEILGLKMISQNDASKKIDDELHNINKQMQDDAERKDKDRKNKEDRRIKDISTDTEKALRFLLATDLTTGWKIKPNWSAVLCESETNDLIRNLPRKGDSSSKGEKTAIGSELKIIRTKIIKLIDEVLNKPIKSYSDNRVREFKEGEIKQAIHVAVNEFCSENKELMDLLFPHNKNNVNALLLDRMGGDKAFPDTKAEYKKPVIQNYLKGFLYAVACAQSAPDEFRDEKQNEWTPKNVYNTLDTKYDKVLPLCKCTNGSNAKNMNEAYVKGELFGMFGIKKYSKKELVKLAKPELPIKYVGEDYKLFKNSPQASFIDPYYNKLGYKQSEYQKYVDGITIHPDFGAKAFIRNILVFIRQMILDGTFISELDIIYNDLIEMYGDNIPSLEDLKKQADKYNKKTTLNGLSKDIMPIQTVGVLPSGLQPAEQALAEIDSKVAAATINDHAPKAFCSRIIYPALLAMTNNDQVFKEDVLNRDYSALESRAMGSNSEAYSDDLSKSIKKFFSALHGLKMIDISEVEKMWADDAQRVSNTLMQEAWVEYSKDPKAYVMHSYYDMLMNDKRGRLVRAFPTYYMLLIDEGRKIGYWKIHDNFYNMSSISTIDVVKSRKMPTDTCNIVMTNMFNSYAAEHNLNTKQQYADLYGIKDAVDSIFSPKRYYEKSQAIKDSIQVPDTVVLKPGVRLHVRMGYSADASRMPVMFNGKVAEVNIGDVVDIVAQGDGNELCNPLNNLGNIETKGLDVAQDMFFNNTFTNFRGGWTKGGYSPRNLLATILTAEYGGKEEILNRITNGRFFNTNPFGITHFGDAKYNVIFDQGEVVQNLFEVTSDNILQGTNGLLLSDPQPKYSTPTINTTLYDKTFWDMLHIAARAGEDYVGAIRDFGFRSTIFLGKPSHYYAYQYKQTDGKILEKRKPFQQYHYVDSYCDIVYNAIKASEKDIKTNAVGLWQARNMTFGKKSATTMPMYLDMNIYPEYQKSMTYDTGLISAGNGGININPFTALGEKQYAGHRSNPDKACDDKVNEKLAIRMTIMALKDAVKDMYMGSICLIGNPAIKPHDRMYIYDTAESMDGDVEVETVIHSLNGQTGFTTTVIPDLIVKARDNEQEMAVKQLMGGLNCTLAANCTMLYMVNHWLANVDNKLLKALYKASLSQTISRNTQKLMKSLFSNSNVAKLGEYNENIGKIAGKIGMTASSSGASVFAKGFKMSIDDILKLGVSEGSDIEDVLRLLNNFEDINVNEFDRIMKDVIADAKKLDDPDMLAKALELEKELDFNKLTGHYEALFDAKYAEAINPKELFKILDADDTVKWTKKEKEFVDQILKGTTDGRINGKKDLKALNAILRKEEVQKILKSSKPAQDALKHGAKDVIKYAGSKGPLLKASKTLATKSLDDIFKGIGGLAKAGFNLASIPLQLAKFAVTCIVAQTSKNFFTTWFESMQTLTIYPIQQYGRNYLAGVSGSMACVYGFPPEDGWNSIQGMIIQMYEKHTKGIGGWVLKTFLLDDWFIDSEAFDKVATTYKMNLGILETDTPSEQDVVEQAYDLVSKDLTSRSNEYASQKYKARIQSLDYSNPDNKTIYNKYAIRNLKAENLEGNNLLAKLSPVEAYPGLKDYISSDKLVIAHNSVKDKKNMDISFEGKTYNMSAVVGKNNKGKDTFDLPTLQSNCNLVLKTILDENYNIDSLKDNVFTLQEGTVVNHNSWASTGFRFTISSLKDAKPAIDKAKEQLNGSLYNMFDCSTTTKTEKGITNYYYRITVFPPKERID